jgi:hypothetical protein
MYAFVSYNLDTSVLVAACLLTRFVRDNQKEFCFFFIKQELT